MRCQTQWTVQRHCKLGKRAAIRQLAVSHRQRRGSFGFMNARFFSRNRLVGIRQANLPDTQKGFALVIVLAFVVLLTVLSVAFFSRAATDRQVSFSSSNQTKADFLARGALSITLGDLKQELAAGSTIST